MARDPRPASLACPHETAISIAGEPRPATAAGGSNPPRNRAAQGLISATMEEVWWSGNWLSCSR
jgi:hypothetical protein